MLASRRGHAHMWSPAWCSASGGHLAECLLQALLSLQACLQDFKLNVLDWHLLPQLGSLLLDMSLMLGATDLVDHYLRDLGSSAAGAASRKGEPEHCKEHLGSPCSITQLLPNAGQPGAAACRVCWKMKQCLVT